jgi:hypothetical protein
MVSGRARSIFFICFFISGFLSLPASRSLGAVSVYDQVTTVGSPVFLEVLTKGLIFAEGGRLVDLYLDDQSIGKILTGGDGHGYRKYTPERPGIIEVRALSNGESGSGLLLVMRKSERAVMIEIEGGFKDAFISEIAASANRRALEKLSQKYRIIYLSRYLGIEMSKNWLSKNEFPRGPVLSWRGPQMLSALKAKGIQLYAIVGSASIIAEAADQIENRYTFEQTQDGQTVKDWDEIIDLLRKRATEKSAKRKGKYKPSPKE